MRRGMRETSWGRLMFCFWACMMVNYVYFVVDPCELHFGRKHFPVVRVMFHNKKVVEFCCFFLFKCFWRIPDLWVETSCSVWRKVQGSPVNIPAVLPFPLPSPPAECRDRIIRLVSFVHWYGDWAFLNINQLAHLSNLIGSWCIVFNILLDIIL